MDDKRDDLIALLVNNFSQDYHAIRNLSYEELQELHEECLEKICETDQDY